MPPPTSADGLTPWVDVDDVDLISFNRYFRWRWRFTLKDGWGEDAAWAAAGGDPEDMPMVTVFDLEIPFVK